MIIEESRIAGTEARFRAEAVKRGPRDSCREAARVVHVTLVETKFQSVEIKVLTTLTGT